MGQHFAVSDITVTRPTLLFFSRDHMDRPSLSKLPASTMKKGEALCPLSTKIYIYILSVYV